MCGRKTRQALMFSFVPMLALSMQHWTPDGDGGAGGSGEKKPADKTADAPPPVTADNPEVKRMIAEALEAERTKTADAEKKKQEAADAEAAKKRGEWEAVATKAQSDVEKAQAENESLRIQLKRAEVRDVVRGILDKDHKAYVGSEKYVLPLIEFDAKTDVAEIEKRAKVIVDQYVKDNPRSGSSGPPPAPSRSGEPRGSVTRKPNGNGDRMTYSSPSPASSL